MNPKHPSKRKIDVKLSQQEYERFKELAKHEARSMTNYASLLIKRFIHQAWATHKDSDVSPGSIEKLNE